MKMKKLMVSLVVAGSIVLLLGSGAPIRAQDPSDPPAEEAEETAQEKRGYEVGMEDVLEIVVWDEPDLSRTVTVRPDGRITLPLIGDVTAAGLPTEAIQEAIAARLATLVREPNVTVIVEEIHSFRVFVLGEVNQQGILEFRRPTRLLQALAAAGGLTSYAKKEVTILRDLGGGETRIRVDLKPLLGGDPRANLFLEPDDTLLVP